MKIIIAVGGVERKVGQVCLIFTMDSHTSSLIHYTSISPVLFTFYIDPFTAVATTSILSRTLCDPA